MLRTIAIALFGIAALGNTAAAECEGEVLVSITGDEEVVRAIEALLAARGITLADGECTKVRAHVERRGDTFAIGVDFIERDVPRPQRTQRHSAVERTVGELATAATVIESFARDDAAPLLPIRSRPQRVTIELAKPVQPAAPASATRGIQIFAAGETSVGSDHTNWMGAHVGVCITLGPICAAVRLRHAQVVAGEGMWRTEMERRSSELLLGLDVPFSLGRTTLSPGFAAGMGSMWTRSDDGTTAGESGGLRADVHVTLSVPVTKRWALDLSTALDLTQETRIESEMPLPAEPLALLRFGFGVRYGGL